MTNTASKPFSIKNVFASIKGRSHLFSNERKSHRNQSRDPSGFLNRVPDKPVKILEESETEYDYSESSHHDLFDGLGLVDSYAERSARRKSSVQTHTTSSESTAKFTKDHDSHENEEALNEFDPEFVSQFQPQEMRCLALVAHNHMKPAMKAFVQAHKNVLKKFMLTGTNTTMTMLKEVFGDDPNVVYGPTCTSGPLGGDAELVSLMVTGRLGGCIFFTDPMSAHPHTADIECLNRQANVHNVIMCPNPTTATTVLATCRYALENDLPGLVPSFFETLKSPSVDVYKASQAAVLKKNMGGAFQETTNI